mmetsp:Transcript_15136/g.27887  ORF Transcript_15136/g.27887 Transcript_15136/m.27887 type:complete len:569 (+) Transcript_15136:61-1767(+)
MAQPSLGEWQEALGSAAEGAITPDSAPSRGASPIACDGEDEVDDEEDQRVASASRSWATSGELLYKSGLLGPEWNEVLDVFKDQLESSENFALEGKDWHNTLETDVNIARECCGRNQTYITKQLVQRQRQVESVVDQSLLGIELREAAVTDIDKDALVQLDKELIGYCAQFASTVEKECALLRNKQEIAERAAKQKIRELNQELAMDEFALHLAEETGEQILLRKLTKDNPQYTRCKRATSENVKADFFGTDSNFSGVEVLGVHKIENKPMLRQFQERAAKLQTGSVKGLFCKIPAESIPRVVVQGLSRASLKTEPRAEHCFGNLFKERIAPDVREDGTLPAGAVVLQDGPGPAQLATLESEWVPFPTKFSRYSTLEMDRNLMSDGDGSEDSPPQYVALCRVIVGECFLTSEDYRGFPSVAPRGKYDSIYSANQEEYLVLNDEFILPEFLVRFQYKGRFPDSEGIRDAPEDTVGISVDLTSPTPQHVDPPGPVPGMHVPSMFLLPGPGDSRTRSSEELQREKSAQLIETAEVQTGFETLHENGTRQREALHARAQAALRKMTLVLESK